MRLSATNRQALLGNICGKSSSISIGSNGHCYLALYAEAAESTPGAIELSSGVYGVEVSGKNYERVNIASDMNTTYISHSLGETQATSHTDRIGNANEIKFNQAIDLSNPSASTGSDWGNIVGYGLFTASTGGTPYCTGKLTQAVEVVTKWTIHFLKGYFEILIGESAVTASVAQGA